MSKEKPCIHKCICGICDLGQEGGERMNNEKDWDESVFYLKTRSEMKPCPKCGRNARGHVEEYDSAFGCDEYWFVAECECGITFYFNEVSDNSPKTVFVEGIEAWNDRKKKVD